MLLITILYDIIDFVVFQIRIYYTVRLEFKCDEISVYNKTSRNSLIGYLPGADILVWQLFAIQYFEIDNAGEMIRYCTSMPENLISP